MPPDQQTKLEAAVARLHRDPTPMTVQSTRMQFYSLVAAVQLASRHPGFSGPTSLVAIHWAREVSAALAANDPDLGQLLAMGWQQEHDAPLAPPTSYLLSSDGRAITCCRCGKTSFHPSDIANLYCGFCHQFHDAPLPNRKSAILNRQSE